MNHKQNKKIIILPDSKRRRLLISFAKWIITMDEMYIEDVNYYVDYYIHENYDKHN